MLDDTTQYPNCFDFLFNNHRFPLKRHHQQLRKQVNGRKALFDNFRKEMALFVEN